MNQQLEANKTVTADAERCKRLEGEVQTLKAVNANLRVQNAKLKFWLHRVGVCTVDGERIEGV